MAEQQKHSTKLQRFNFWSVVGLILLGTPYGLALSLWPDTTVKYTKITVVTIAEGWDSPSWLIIVTVFVILAVSIYLLRKSHLIWKIPFALFYLSLPHLLGWDAENDSIYPVWFVFMIFLVIGEIGYQLKKFSPGIKATKIKSKFLAEGAAKIQGILNHKDGGVWIGHANGKDLYASIEDRGSVIAPSGGGKTTYLTSKIFKWAEETGRPFIAVDPKPELFGITQAKLEGLGYRVLVFNPTAERGERYNLIDDIEGPEQIGELAATLIPPGDEKNAVFTENARLLVDALIRHARATGQQASLVTLGEIMATCLSPEDLLKILLTSPDAIVRTIGKRLSMIGSNERMMGSIFAVFAANLRFAMDFPAVMASLETSDFSLKDLTTGKPVALFLQFEEAYRDTTARLLTVLMAHIMRYFIQHTDRPPILLLFDEIGTIPAIPSLIEKLNTIRSRHLPTWLYWQNVSQMAERYGRDGVDTIDLVMGACPIQMTMRPQDNASPQWFSERIGVTNVTVVNETQQTGEIFSKTKTTSMSVNPAFIRMRSPSLRPMCACCSTLARRRRSTRRLISRSGANTGTRNHHPMIFGARPIRSGKPRLFRLAGRLPGNAAAQTQTP